MENYKFSILSNLQNILTFKNVELLKESFIVKSIRNEEQPTNLNSEFGIIEYYDSYKEDFIVLNFENQLKELLWEETQICKSSIDTSLILLNSIDKKKFIEYIKATISYIENSESKLLQKFPVCKKPFEEIILYLNEKYKINFDTNISPKINESLFKIKSGISKSQLIKLYDITIKYEIIDDESISEETFISVFIDKETDEKIVFNSKNGLTMKYLETISSLFDNLTGKSIENSSRFYTKGKTLISQSNYNKAKKEISEKEGKILSSFIKDFDLIFK
ncbi:hypothetical protein [Flavobacterium humi]|uniref:Uncharacterized protein n=1 Tax=Flavobacterium humi TaxID=2562683 RepID=A0A4Z0L8N0_9FLAO|nr:hypothetical protein [Flavobacterium humi]TGD57525.1 hypothetical protein E4635_10040 [Flavobacterium humi]